MKEETKYQDLLKGMISDMIDNKTKDEATDIAAATNEKVVKMLEENAELKARLEAIEKMPAQKFSVPVPGNEQMKKDFMYKGYDLRRQGMNISIPEEKREGYAKFLIDCIKATNVEGNGARGGYLVPDEYSDTVLAFSRLSSFAMRECNVVSMGTDVMRIPAELANVGVTWTAEEIDLGATNPTYSEVVLTAERLGAYSIASNEMLADEQYDFVSMLTSQFAEAIAIEIDSQVVNGGTFTGALSGCTANTVSCAATGTSPNRNIQITNAELSEAISKLTDNKLMGSKFYIGLNAMHYIRVLADDNNRPIFANPGNGVPGTIYEYPYVVTSAMPAAPAAASGFIIFGNMKNYLLGMRRGNMSLEVDPYGLFDTYRTRFRMVTRWAGKPGLCGGLVIIKTHA